MYYVVIWQGSHNVNYKAQFRWKIYQGKYKDIKKIAYNNVNRDFFVGSIDKILKKDIDNIEKWLEERRYYNSMWQDVKKWGED